MIKIVLIVLIVALVAIVIAQVFAEKTSKSGGYKPRQLMTENEAEFFGRLVVALPEHYVFPQVSLASLIEAAAKDRKRAYSDYLRIAQQRVDYVVCDRSCQVVAVVELDDKTHSRKKDELRDSRLQQAGIRTVRLQSRNKPTTAVLRAMVLSEPARASSEAAVA